MIKLLKYLKGSAIICAILAPLTMCLEVAMDLLQPTLLSKIIDTGVANGDLNYVLYIGIQMVIAAVVGLIAGSACSYFAAVASMNLGQEVRQGLFDKIQTLSFVELDKLKTSSLITRLTNDITQVQMMMNMALRMMVRAPLTAIGGIIMAYILSPKLSTIFLIAIPIITVSVLFILKKSLPLFTKVQQNIDNVNTVMRESILGVKVIKAFAIENTQKSRFIEANEELTNTSIKSQNMNLILWPMATLIMNLTVVCVLWFGGNMVNTGDLEIGKIVFGESKEIVDELKNIDAILQNAIYKSDIQILMYENAIRQYISNGRLSFFNTTITLSLKQRQRHIEYMEKILKENEDIDIKLINGNLVDDFKNKENPTAYLSRNINIIKGNFDEYSEYENKYLIIRDNRLDNIFKRFFKEVWESERYNISKFKEEAIIRISDLLNYINILKSTVEK